MVPTVRKTHIFCFIWTDFSCLRKIISEIDQEKSVATRKRMKRKKILCRMRQGSEVAEEVAEFGGLGSVLFNREHQI